MSTGTEYKMKYDEQHVELLSLRFAALHAALRSGACVADIHWHQNRINLTIHRLLESAKLEPEPEPALSPKSITRAAEKIRRFASAYGMNPKKLREITNDRDLVPAFVAQYEDAEQPPTEQAQESAPCIGASHDKVVADHARDRDDLLRSFFT